MAIPNPGLEAIASVVSRPDVGRPDHRFDPVGTREEPIVKYLQNGGRLFLRNTVSLLGVSRQANQTVAVFDRDETSPPKSKEVSEDIIHRAVDQAVLKRPATSEEIELAYNAPVLRALDPRFLKVVELLAPAADPDVLVATGWTSNPFVEIPKPSPQLV